MPAYTNMAWPDDPYGTGQLWRTEPSLLAAFAACCVDDGNRAVPVGYAAAYLRLHRSKPIDATSGPAFGFRAVSATSEPELDELVRLYDLDVMRARRLAKIIAGHRLADDLYAMETATAGGEIGRGIRSLATDWQHPGRGRAGMASLFDVANTLTDGDDLADAAAVSGIDVATVQRAFSPKRCVDLAVEAARLNIPAGRSPGVVAEQGREGGMVGRCALEWLAAYCTERAMISALVAGRYLERYTWDGPLDVGAVLAANVWDCFPLQTLSPEEKAV